MNEGAGDLRKARQLETTGLRNFDKSCRRVAMSCKIGVWNLSKKSWGGKEIRKMTLACPETRRCIRRISATRQQATVGYTAYCPRLDAPVLLFLNYFFSKRHAPKLFFGMPGRAADQPSKVNCSLSVSINGLFKCRPIKPSTVILAIRPQIQRSILNQHDPV